jgi:hypothetical protein
MVFVIFITQYPVTLSSTLRYKRVNVLDMKRCVWALKNQKAIGDIQVRVNRAFESGVAAMIST